MAARAGTDVVKAGYWFVGYDKIRLAPDIPSELFTHLYAGFAVVDSDTGGVTFPTKYQEQFQTFPTTVRKRNPTLKALLSIGGPGSDISPVVRDGAKLARFIKDSIHLAWTFGYDGLDLYWLFPSPFDNCDNLINLLNPWRGAVSQDAKNRNKLELLLTATVFHHQANPNISIFLDWINVLAIDFYTPSNSPKETGPVHAWLHPKEPNRCGSDGIRHWINSGVAANKLVFGLPFYGYEWKLIDPNVYGYFAPANPADYNYIDYKNIQKIVGKAKYQTWYNTDYVGTYSHNYVGSWIGYDDKNSISEKVKKAIPTYKLRGYFAWNLGGDDDKWTLTKAGQKWWLVELAFTLASAIFH
ncbi:class V chitinase-like, partial [Carya illinoinensis]